ncbi:MAG: Coenzyme F420 hydrogenase/dehydrogenase, beta subunit C-terminal domain [Deltaproteobacteria bacterium]|nr:Coenzyme F420 hydrogenase/dehydrogenase, beta subunit C-terminal domain [Deltaproteobacteria bacterium]
MRSIKTIKDVVGWGLCVGCGACQYYCGIDSIELENIESIGIRPKFKKLDCIKYAECLKFCPGYSIGAERSCEQNNPPIADSLIGPVLEIWQGYAVDQEIRYKASSGGALSALASYCLEKENMEFVVHTGMDENIPWYNKTVKSKSRADILARTGSRYAPSSPCEALSLIEASSQSCVFIGKPCDVAAVSALRKHRPQLDKNLGLVLTFFCAGPPCTTATLSLLKHMDVDKTTANEIRYRGNGWPGFFQVSFNNGVEPKKLTYEESWGKLAKHSRSLRCNLCPDGLGELADISCGDAWHLYDRQKGDPGRSLVLSRSIRGNDILHRAMESGYLQLEKSNTADVIKAQPMTGRRAAIWGRLAAMETLLMPVPQFFGFPLSEVWQSNPIKLKIKTYLGTLRRLLMRGLWHQNSLNYTQ